jgi:hypothetical protein
MRKEFKTTLLLTSLLAGMIVAVPHPTWAERKGTNVLFLLREVVENMLWDEGQTQMGKTSVQGSFSGLGAATDSIVAVNMERKFDLFEAYIGYAKTAPPGRSCTFQVAADGSTLYTSEVITSGGHEPEKIKVPVRGHSYLTLRIIPEGYGMTSGACFGTPMLYSGVSPEEMAPMLTVDFNGEKIKLEEPGGRAPTELKVPIPLKTGEYRVKVKFEKDTNHAVITSEPVTP